MTAKLILTISVAALIGHQTTSLTPVKPLTAPATLKSQGKTYDSRNVAKKSNIRKRQTKSGTVRSNSDSLIKGQTQQKSLEQKVASVLRKTGEKNTGGNHQVVKTVVKGVVGHALRRVSPSLADAVLPADKKNNVKKAVLGRALHRIAPSLTDAAPPADKKSSGKKIAKPGKWAGSLLRAAGRQ